LPPPPIAGQDYVHQLAVSLVEDVTIGLCRSKALSIVAPHTAWELSQSGKKTLFRTFGIDYAVETRLQSRDGESWLTLKLLDPVSREILWTDQYCLGPEQIARRYREISVRILSSLLERVERAELSRYEREHHATAYHLYLAGQRQLRALDLPHVRRARRAFKSALSICPDFVPTLSGLAKTLRLEWVLLARGDPDLLVEAEKLARRSVELDPDDARGYRELGACTLYTGRFEESLRALGDGETRNPQFADLLMDFGDALTHASDAASGLKKIERAIELNPLCPDQYWWAAGGANFHLHQYEDAIECIQRMQDQTPAFRLLAASHAMIGNQEEAARFTRKTKEFHPDFSVAGWLSILPIREKAYARHYEEGLRRAGFD
jgi:tetratricopeptide (TPR) repeat protein